MINMKPNIEYISQLTGGNDYLCSRITEILQLKYQLDHPDEQSFYFKSGIKSQKDRLDILTKEFESFKTIVNDFSVEELAAALKIEQKKVSEADTLNCSRRSQVMALSISRSMINTIRLHQNVKRDVGNVPELGFFRR